jgi:polyisoprenoid-binding protein YceI
MRSPSALGLFLGTFTAGAIALAAYAPLELDTVHSKVGFMAGTGLFDVSGEFGEYTVEIDGDPETPESVTLKVTIAVASINTQNTKRDAHLKSPEFFDAVKYPSIVFTSTSVQPRGHKLFVTGNLAMHGQTKEITIVFKVAKGKNGAGVDATSYKGTVMLNRSDFGIGDDSLLRKWGISNEVEAKLLIVTAH